LTKPKETIMPEYIFAYHGGHTPDDPEEIEKVMAAWGAWFAAMGDAVAQPGAPLGMAKTVSATGITEGGGINPLTGYTVVRAASFEAATGMAKGCPILENNSGSVEVAEVVKM
jgi:hypothetical protein